LHKKTKTGLFLIFIFTLVTLFVYYNKIYCLPGELRIIQGEEKTLEFNFPINARLKSDNLDFLVNGDILEENFLVDLSKPVSLKFLDQGTTTLKFKLGFLPLKEIKVNVIPQKKVVPGGHSIGVKLISNGLIVVGYSNLTDNKRKYSPGRQKGILIGDVLLEINNEKIKNSDHMAELIDKSQGSEIMVKLNRGQKQLTFFVKPIFNDDEEVFQIGLWVRETAAGVGTLTFYDPDKMLFGALGHIITDVDTGKPIEIKEGEIIHAKVTAIEKGERRSPGEKKGVFIRESEVIGKIKANSEFGIFGELIRELPNPFYGVVPIAITGEIQNGPAEILTVVQGNKIEKFDIEIIKIFNQNTPNAKGMIIEITDSQLINQTGGIIQGMSGSPILQGGKLVGAVTHVFVNTPAKGYGVFAEWMSNSMDEIEQVREKAANYY